MTISTAACTFVFGATMVASSYLVAQASETVMFAFISEQRNEVEWPAQALLLKLMERGSEDLTGTQIRSTLSSLGVLQVNSWSPSRISFLASGSTANLQLALPTIEGLVFRPRLQETQFEVAKREAKATRMSSWDAAALGGRLDFDAVRYEDVLRAGQTFFQPSNFIGWRTNAAIPPLKGEPLAIRKMITVSRSGPLLPVAPVHERITQFDMGSVRPEDRTKAIAMFALGVGKGSTLFEVFRTTKRWSYRQELVVLPTGDGYRWLLQAQCSLQTQNPAHRLPDRSTQVQALAEHVKSWDDQSLARAVALYNASCSRGHVFSPFYAGVWPQGLTAPAGPNWPLARELNAADLELQAVKQAAIEALEAAEFREF